MLSCQTEIMIQNYKHQIFHIKAPIPYDFTLYENIQSDFHSIIYYLHGSGGDHKTWGEANQDMIRYWQSQNKAMPIVAGISFGPGWMLNPKNQSEKSGYLEYFISEAMPLIESKIDDKIINRYLIGFSMGGHNVAQLVFRYPEKFKKAAILSPSILPFSPYSETKIISNYISKTKEKASDIIIELKNIILQRDQITENILFLIEKYKQYIPDNKAWDETNIFKNIKSVNPNQSPEIYISCGKKDQLGLFIGADLLSQESIKNNYTTTYNILNGKHNITDYKSVVDFFIDN